MMRPQAGWRAAGDSLRMCGFTALSGNAVQHQHDRLIRTGSGFIRLPTASRGTQPIRLFTAHFIRLSRTATLVLGKIGLYGDCMQ